MDLLQKFDEVKIQRSRLVKLRSQLSEIEKDISTKNTELIKLKKALEKEFKDYKRIEETTLSSLFYSILGNKTAKLEKERQEYLFAKLKYDNLLEEIELSEHQKDKLISEIEPLKPFEKEYQSLLLEKEQYLSKIQDKKGIELQQINDDISHLKTDIKETQEAIDAGKTARNKLLVILGHLDKAKNWGVYDMIGGGSLSSMIKHSKINDAKREVSQAQYYINRFIKELKDLDNSLNIQESIQIEGFYKFADIFFDGLIFDFVVQEKIYKSTQQIKATSLKIYHICNQLKRQNQQHKRELKRKERKRLEILNG